MLLRPLHVDVVLCNQQEIATALLLSKRKNISHWLLCVTMHSLSKRVAIQALHLQSLIFHSNAVAIWLKGSQTVVYLPFVNVLLLHWCGQALDIDEVYFHMCYVYTLWCNKGQIQACLMRWKLGLINVQLDLCELKLMQIQKHGFSNPAPCMEAVCATWLHGGSTGNLTSVLLAIAMEVSACSI
jgi:hypothetical protein